MKTLFLILCGVSVFCLASVVQAGHAARSASAAPSETADAAVATVASITKADPGVGLSEEGSGAESGQGCSHGRSITCGTFKVRRVKIECADNEVRIRPKLRFDPRLPRDARTVSGGMVREDGRSSSVCWWMDEKGRKGSPHYARFPKDMRGKVEFTITERSDQGGKVCERFTKRIRCR